MRCGAVLQQGRKSSGVAGLRAAPIYQHATQDRDHEIADALNARRGRRGRRRSLDVGGGPYLGVTVTAPSLDAASLPSIEAAAALTPDQVLDAVGSRASGLTIDGGCGTV